MAWSGGERPKTNWKLRCVRTHASCTDLHAKDQADLGGLGHMYRTSCVCVGLGGLGLGIWLFGQIWAMANGGKIIFREYRRLIFSARDAQSMQS